MGRPENLVGKKSTQKKLGQGKAAVQATVLFTPHPPHPIHPLSPSPSCFILRLRVLINDLQIGHAIRSLAVSKSRCLEVYMVLLLDC
jgi:hypothetical protein